MRLYNSEVLEAVRFRQAKIKRDAEARRRRIREDYERFERRLRDRRSGAD